MPQRFPLTLTRNTMPAAIIPFEAFAVFWIVYIVLGFPLAFGRNLALKRRFARPYIIGSGIVFIAGMALTGLPLFLVAIATPLVGLITWLNLRQFRYCSACGATAFYFPFARPRFCARCGADLRSDSASPAA